LGKTSPEGGEERDAFFEARGGTRSKAVFSTRPLGGREEKAALPNEKAKRVRLWGHKWNLLPEG